MSKLPDRDKICYHEPTSLYLGTLVEPQVDRSAGLAISSRDYYVHGVVCHSAIVDSLRGIELGNIAQVASLKVALEQQQKAV